MDHDRLEPFEPILDSLLPLVFEYGIAALQKSGDITDPAQLVQVIKDGKSAHRRFIRGCHYGWELAQRRIAELVISNEEKLRALRDALKMRRRERNREDVAAHETLIRCIELRQIVLRRLADTILYHQLELQNWVLRRLSLEYRIRDIDPNVVRKTAAIASDLNHDERLDFHLVADLTTVVHVGDLVKVSFVSRPPEWSLIELKDGKMNALLADVIEKAGGDLQEEHLEKIRNQYGVKAVAQAKRIVRQQQRQRDVMKVVTTDEGVDIKHGNPIKLVPEIVHVDEYDATLRTMCEKAKTEGVAVSIISGALRLIAMNKNTLQSQGQGGLAHLLYHYQFGIRECELQTDSKKELEGMSRIYPFFNLVQMNLYAMWPPPIFLWHMPPELVMDLLFERVSVFAQLDYSKLFDAAHAQGIEMRWANADELGEMRNVATAIPGSPRASAVGIRLAAKPDLPEQFLLAGFFSRVFLEFMSPSQLLKLVHRDFEFAQKA